VGGKKVLIQRKNVPERANESMALLSVEVPEEVPEGYVEYRNDPVVESFEL